MPTRNEGVIPFPDDYSIAVAFCGKAAEKTGDALKSYNEASLAARRVLALWNEASGQSELTLGAAIANDAGAAGEIRLLLDRKGERRLRDRFDQFALESEDLVPRAAAALASGELTTFGELVATSHLAAEALLGNQIPATSRLVRLARDAGAVASSAFGAGFGGSVWAMVASSDEEPFTKEWRERYRREFPELAGHAEFFVTRPGPGATAI
jgi:galactokinase